MTSCLGFFGIAIHDVSYQIQLHEAREQGEGMNGITTKDDFSNPRLTEVDSRQTSKTPSADELCEPIRHRFHPRIDLTVLYFEIKKLTLKIFYFVSKDKKTRRQFLIQHLKVPGEFWFEMFW